MKKKDAIKLIDEQTRVIDQLLKKHRASLLIDLARLINGPQYEGKKK